MLKSATTFVKIVHILDLSKLGNLQTINISNNLIGTLIELSNIRFLSSLKEINLNKNPVKLNPNCEQTIREILENIKAKNSFKQSLQATNLSWANFQNYQLKTSNGPKKFLRKVTIDETSKSSEDGSSPSYPKIQIKRGASSLRLKANNILIEQTDETSDYIIINKKNDKLNQIDQLFNGQNTSADDNAEGAVLSILCLGEQYLIEKDETNSEILGQYEYSSLSEIVNMTKIKNFIKEIDAELYYYQIKVDHAQNFPLLFIFNFTFN
ncbi:hypothetical protein BpHYR1_016612 [Brachionus plicatilis]|uniref:Uncharacterized protein n=1 Tax=Brachionus plicatilis TaxID=10195 RepID=A0A3M7SKE3_BRAPC|nr:hypothetical protein BpHYR1_016612 [Brachionus plicatilis]